MALTRDSWTVETFAAFLPEFAVDIILDDKPTSRAINGSLTASRRAELFDLGENYIGSVYVESAEFPNRVETGDTITVSRKTYEVVGTNHDALDAILRIDYGERFAA